jgi:hypothetical protein
MTPDVINEIGVDMISIVYSNEPVRKDFLTDLQRSTNNFEQDIPITENDEIEIEEG